MATKVGPTASLAKLLGNKGLPGDLSPTGLYPSSSCSPLPKALDKLPHDPERLKDDDDPAPIEEIELERDLPIDGYGGSGEMGEGAT